MQNTSLRTQILHHAQSATQGDTEHSWCKRFFVPHDFIAFQGHFPEKPVLPAVVQILMAELTIAEVTQRTLPLTEVPQAKFTAPIEPDSTITCTVTRKEAHIWDCTMTVGEILAAKFRCIFERSTS